MSRDCSVFPRTIGDWTLRGSVVRFRPTAKADSRLRPSRRSRQARPVHHLGATSEGAMVQADRPVRDRARSVRDRIAVDQQAPVDRPARHACRRASRPGRPSQPRRSRPLRGGHPARRRRHRRRRAPGRSHGHPHRPLALGQVRGRRARQPRRHLVGRGQPADLRGTLRADAREGHRPSGRSRDLRQGRLRRRPPDAPPDQPS